VEVPVSRRFLLIFVPLLALQVSPCALRASQNAQEAKQSRPSSDTAAQADPQNRDKSSLKSSDSARPAASEKNSAAAPQPAETTGNSPNAPAGTATLNIRIRTQDDSPFAGMANLRVVSHQGSELSGVKSASEGETVYSALPPGSYSIEASAPGFAPVKQTIDIESGKSAQTLFLIMKPDIPSAGSQTPSPKPISATAEEISRTSIPPAPAETLEPNLEWVPPGVDASKPDVALGVSCDLPAVLAGVSERTKEFVANLQKFSATEHVDHYAIDFNGHRLPSQSRTFEYIAVINNVDNGLFSLDEYLNGSLDRSRFPGGIATEGVPAVALLFHPMLAADYDFKCEGLGNRKGRPAWQVYFIQREDRPSRIGGYRTLSGFYPFDLKGRAWIDAATYQILGLESELVKPIPAAGLKKQMEIINYGSVSFHSHKQQLWLPQSVEVYFDGRERRFYRTLSFSDFKIFTVDADQSIHAPKESYCFTNTSDHDVAGVLVVSSASGISLKSVSIRFTIPPGGSIYKVVGPGKDISMPVDEVGSATFTHNGPADSIKADAYLVKESTLDVIADSPISINP
jgi:Carboxypeptidase regulatory-like domain